MTATAPGGDVRGFYLDLGVELPGWAHTEASVRCFADPDAHQHQDRDASCSVNLESGAFNCHGCGAHGGAYDAALAKGFSAREAIDVMVAHGLTERRHPGSPRVASPALAHDSRPGVIRTRLNARATGSRAPASGGRANAPASLTVSSAHARAWARALGENPGLLARLCRERGWQPGTLRALGIGFDGERITVPISDERGALQGLLRLRVEQWQRPKVIAVAGTRLGLIPYPKLASGPVVLVEGPSDMLAARSVGLSAIAVPGTHAW